MMLSFISKKIRRLCRFILTCLFLPCAYVLYLCGFRFFELIHVHAIGHLSLEPDVYLKRVLLGLEKKYKMVLLAPTKRLSSNYPEKIVCNAALLDYWEKYFTVIRSPRISLFFQRKRWKFLYYPIPNYVMHYKEPSLIYETYGSYKGKSLVDLNSRHLHEGKEALERLSIPKNAWFICFHSRDHDFNPIEKDSHFACRNSDINTLYSALEEVSKKGGYAIRLGDKKSKPLGPRFQNLNIVDYTKTSEKSDWMDLFLMKNARFFIGGSCGLSHLATTLGTPCVLVNCVPICHIPFTSSDLVILKLYFDKTRHRLLSFSEILHSPAAHYMHVSEFESENIDVISNSEEEIKEVVLEMFAKMEGKTTLSEKEILLRQKFSSHFHKNHFCYGFKSNVGISFLEKYKHLL